MSWTPLLDGPLAAAVEESVQEIAEALETDSPDVRGLTFCAGYAGLALFHGYLAVTHGDDHAAALSARRLEQAFDAASGEGSPPMGFFNGLCGIAWAGQHLSELLEGDADADMNEEVDQILAEVVRSSPWNWEYDLIYGLAGIGCYALDHPNRGFAMDVLQQIVLRLDELAANCDTGVTWRTPPSLMHPKTAERYPEGYYNLGVSHGVPGVLGTLGRICGAGREVEGARRLLDGAVAWLFANKRPDDGGSTYSYFAGEEASARSAWCYGDPGIAAVLLCAARSAGELSWEREAIALARKDCARPASDTGVVDAEICHGAAGLGHLYNRLYQATGEKIFADTARIWFERVLAMRRPGEGIAGYLNWWPEDGDWHAESGFLVGAAGIGLALLAATSSTEPHWDRPMHLAIPGSGR